MANRKKLPAWLWNLILPNSKKVADCTGFEAVAFLQKISEGDAAIVRDDEGNFHLIERPCHV